MVKAYGSVKRFGTRYGRKLRFKVGQVEAAKRESSCPYCSSKRVLRIASGIWCCRKCSSKFTAQAYTIKKVAEED